MNSSDKPDVPVPAVIFAAEGGIPIEVASVSDPYTALDDLMYVVEALCPVWPERGTFVEGPHWLL
jgi:hypothetical protein